MVKLAPQSPLLNFVNRGQIYSVFFSQMGRRGVGAPNLFGLLPRYFGTSRWRLKISRLHSGAVGLTSRITSGICMGLMSSLANAVLCVLRKCSKSQVIWVYAKRGIAYVHDDFISRDFPTGDLPSKPMRVNMLLLFCGKRIVKSTVSLVIGRPHPEPASLCLVDLFPKAPDHNPIVFGRCHGCFGY